MKTSLIKDKSFEFALSIIQLYKTLQQNKEFIISKQLLRSGTGIGANVSEALAGESRADFLHKMAIASKEARETIYWLELLDKSNLVNNNYQKHIEDCMSIVKILTAIVHTTKSNLKSKT
ncbi:four helix bundle protein [Aequorivita echinoideorum]|uniref:Four helix bundle protein n=1 Tax=Aequorivita echinoideorum TaxID=1549647 RepID=A0ABS5S2T6_9FLAO|nr:four helix bundle protein [Aequorivita echinoideorum]MBT0607522.1 four helix bundle protein [Aequorivita echinoideorum]